MSRDALLGMLKRYQEKYPEELAVVSRLAAFVAEHEDCFHRSLREGHVTGSAWVVDQTGKKVLLTHHRKLNRWLQLGGHADGDSDVLAVAMREVEEESGLEQVQPCSSEIFDIDIHPIPLRGSEAAHLHYDIRFAFVNVGSEAYCVSDESHDLRWIDLQELSKVTQEESMRRMARKWQARSVADGDASRGRF